MSNRRTVLSPSTGAFHPMESVDEELAGAIPEEDTAPEDSAALDKAALLELSEDELGSTGHSEIFRELSVVKQALSPPS